MFQGCLHTGTKCFTRGIRTPLRIPQKGRQQKNAHDDGTATVFASAAPSTAQHLKESPSRVLGARGEGGGRRRQVNHSTREGFNTAVILSNENEERVPYTSGKAFAGATEFQLSRQKANCVRELRHRLARGRLASKMGTASPFIDDVNPTTHFVPEQWGPPVLPDERVLKGLLPLLCTR